MSYLNRYCFSALSASAAGLDRVQKFRETALFPAPLDMTQLKRRFLQLILGLGAFAPILMAQSKYTADVLALNPLGYWRLEQNAADATAHANNGTLNGVTFTDAGAGAPI